jgi:hypothetical protein
MSSTIRASTKAGSDMAVNSNIEVVLTDESESHCFKLIFRAAPAPGFDPVPFEVLLHTTQAIDLFSQLATQLSNYMYKASAELLRIKRKELGS